MYQIKEGKCKLLSERNLEIKFAGDMSKYNSSNIVLYFSFCFTYKYKFTVLSSSTSIFCI